MIPWWMYLVGGLAGGAAGWVLGRIDIPTAVRALLLFAMVIAVSVLAVILFVSGVVRAEDLRLPGDGWAEWGDDGEVVVRDGDGRTVYVVEPYLWTDDLVVLDRDGRIVLVIEGGIIE